ncbi:MAG: preprotein translocase subunit SecG [Novosphingobium sp.]
MSLFLFLTVVQALIAALLVLVILMQKSEGGGLGVGGSPSGLMSARGAADFLTRATAVLATMFVIMSIVLATLAVGATAGREIDTSLQRTVAPAAPIVPADPLAGVNQPVAPTALPVPAAAPAAAPAARRGDTEPRRKVAPANTATPVDPLAGVKWPASSTAAPATSPTPR